LKNKTPIIILIVAIAMILYFTYTSVMNGISFGFQDIGNIDLSSLSISDLLKTGTVNVKTTVNLTIVNASNFNLTANNFTITLYNADNGAILFNTPTPQNITILGNGFSNIVPINANVYGSVDNITFFKNIKAGVSVNIHYIADMTILGLPIHLDSTITYP
jgi:hypothetical protein